MKICISCKCEVPVNAKFCPECGTAQPANDEKTDGFVDTQSPVHGEDSFGQTLHRFQTQTSSFEQCGGVKPAKDKRVTGAIADARFIFTNAVVFLALFSITIFFSIARLGNMIGRNLNMATFVIYLVFFGLMHITSLVLLVVFGSKAKRQDIPLARQTKTATGLFVASLTALIFGSLFGLCDFISLMMRTGSEIFVLQFFWVIPLHIIALVFSILNLSRTRTYKKNVGLMIDDNND